jgi:transcriptional regulator with XRE-family HTH domain
MNSPQGVHPTVQVDGQLLKADRKAAGHTQASFAERCGSVTLVTVRRAEQGNRIIRSSLKRMADVLGRPLKRYIPIDIFSDTSEFVVSVAGAWTGFFIDAGPGTSPRLVEESIVFEQNGHHVSGDLKSASTSQTSHKILETTKVADNVVFGLTLVPGLPVPSGLGSFMLASTKNNDWLEGFRCWHNPDSDCTEFSKMIAVRNSTPRFSQYIEEARSLIEKEVPAFQLRKLMEAGYGVGDASVMLSALDTVNADEFMSSIGPTDKTGAKGKTRIQGTEYLDQQKLSYETLLKHIIALDRKNLDFRNSEDGERNHEGSASQWTPIYREHPQNWRLLTQGNAVKGYWHFCALRSDIFNEAKQGLLLDSKLSLADIEPFLLPGTYSIYVTTLICDPKLRFGRSFKLLFDSIFIVIEELAKDFIFIEEIVFAAWSDSSVKLAERLGFTTTVNLKNTDVTVPIYKAHMDTILERDELREFTSLRHRYQKRPAD